jgi:hypothetical protein
MVDEALVTRSSSALTTDARRSQPTLCRSVTGSYRAAAFDFHSTVTSVTLYWFDYIANELNKAAPRPLRLVPTFPYLDAELVAPMQPLAATRFEHDALLRGLDP